MFPAAASLLGALGSMIRPGGASAVPTAGASSPIGPDGDFANALARAESGDLTSNAPIKIAKGLDLKLSEGQLARLSGVADRAEAQGAGRAIVLIDGQALTLDVASRTITGRADINSTQIHAGTDAVITVAPENSQPSAALLGPPSAGAATLANPSLLKSLSTPKSAVAATGDEDEF